MHADSSAARLGWPGRRAKASAGRRTVFPKCGAAFQGPGAFEGGRTKIERGRTKIEGGAQASKGGAAPRYVALANSLHYLLKYISFGDILIIVYPHRGKKSRCLHSSI